MATLRSNYTQESSHGAYSASIATAFTIPALSGTATQAFDTVSWVSVGQVVYFSDGVSWGLFTVTAVDSGADTVTLENTWDEVNGTVINVDGRLSPAGRPGDQGIQGVQGVQGDPGISAYQVAVNNGFVGTEQEWLDSLKSEEASNAEGVKALYESNADTNAYTDAEKTKLAGIASGAEVNVQSDWDAVSGDAFILNKPSTFPPSSHTQTASTITDFDTEVSNNTDVAANTSARHDAVTVVDSSEIDFTLTGQQITASIVAGSIDETKLDASVNASLDLADTALQAGDPLTDLSSGDAVDGQVPIADGLGGIAWEDSSGGWDGTTAIDVTANGAASTPPVTLSGTWFTGGTTTTTTPQFLIQPTGTTSTNWNVAGTGLGVNAPSGFTGNLLDLQVNGSSTFRYDGTTLTLGDGAKTIQTVNSDLTIRAGGFKTLILDCLAKIYVGTSAEKTLEAGGVSGRNGITYAANGESLTVKGGDVLSSSTSIRVGGHVYIRGGSGGGTTATGDAHGGSVYLDGGIAYGTGTIGNIKVGESRGVLEIAGAMTVATLPSSPAIGMIARVTDADTPSSGSTVTGGGASNALVWYNGTNWTVLGV